MNMRTHTAKPMCRTAGILAGVALTLIALPADAQSGANRSVNLAARQSLLVEQMTNGAMLAVLGIDPNENIRAVRSSRDLFNSTLHGLRNGDDELGLSATTTPEVLDELLRVEALWPRYDRTLQAIITPLETSADVTERQVRELSDIHTVIIAAVDRSTDVFERYSLGGAHHSIRSTTLNGAGQLRTQSQLMLGQLLAIAYDDRGEQNRPLLGEAARDFDRTLTGLIEGDPELRLLAAPTDEIRAEMAKVRRLWIEVRPILERVAAGASADEQSITTISRHTRRMIGPLNMTAFMYENL